MDSDLPIIDFAKWGVGSTQEELSVIGKQLADACHEVGFGEQYLRMSSCIPRSELSPSPRYPQEGLDAIERYAMLYDYLDE